MQACTVSVDPEQFYKTFGDMGIQFGHSSKTLNKVFFSQFTQRATATITLDDWKSKTPATNYSDHLIHSTALDSPFHLPFVVLTDGGTRVLPTMLPTQFANIWVS